MSHIFDALQRFESERSGVPPERWLSLATELLQSAESAERQATANEPTDFGPLVFRQLDLNQLQSLDVSLPPAGRLVCLTEKESLGAEKFRFLGVRLRQLQQSRSLKKLLITSTIPEEGKSTVSGNLAAILARRRKQKILLVEGDLRRPSLSSQFGLHQLPGLSEWLQGDPSGPMANIYHLKGPGFWFLPSGRPPEDPLELMQSGRLPELMDQLSAWFDWIVIDSPPVLPLADTSVWMRLADGILLVTREGTTEKRQLQRGLQALDPSKLCGAVLNSSKNNDHNAYYQRYAPIRAKSQSDLRQRFWTMLDNFRSTVYPAVQARFLSTLYSPRVRRKAAELLERVLRRNHEDRPGSSVEKRELALRSASKMGTDEIGG